MKTKTKWTAFLTLFRSSCRGAHPVDKSLMVFMVLLLAQSAYSLFFPSPAGQAAGDIDIIVRTSAAAIFGYFLSANFARRSAGKTSPLPPAEHSIKTAENASASDGPLNRIGFSADAAPPQSGSALSSSRGEDAAGCLQVVIATVIGLFCLITLLVLRNAPQGGGAAADASVTATVAQFRDFVSGCVGFLIGSPTGSSDSAA